MFSHIYKCKIDFLGLLNDFFGIKYGRGFDYPVLGNWNTFTFLNVVPRTWSKVQYRSQAFGYSFTRDHLLPTIIEQRNCLESIIIIEFLT